MNYIKPATRPILFRIAEVIVFKGPKKGSRADTWNIQSNTGVPPGTHSKTYPVANRRDSWWDIENVYTVGKLG